MKMTFYKNQAEKHKVTPDAICEEIEDLGFEASLLNTHEIIKQDNFDEEKGGINRNSISTKPTIK